jgi:hypothetical protein
LGLSVKKTYFVAKDGAECCIFYTRKVSVEGKDSIVYTNEKQELAEEVTQSKINFDLHQKYNFLDIQFDVSKTMFETQRMIVKYLYQRGELSIEQVSKSKEILTFSEPLKVDILDTFNSILEGIISESALKNGMEKGEFSRFVRARISKNNGKL